MRDNKGTQRPQDHPLYPATFELYVSYLEHKKPRSVFFENVTAILQASDDADAEHNNSVEKLQRIMESLGYATGVRVLSHSVFFTMERERCCLVTSFCFGL